MPADIARTRDALRRTLRARRRAFAGTERETAQASLLRTLSRLPIYRRARHVAVYFAADGEADLSGLYAAALRRGIALYAPCLSDDCLSFRALDGDTVLTVNRYGIPEPGNGAPIDPRSLDLVLTPLVGFDDTGTRLGMGKGFYDRAFEFLRLRRHWQKPKLIGVAFAFQEVPALAAAPWDVALWGVVTDAGARYFRLEYTA